jgi:hypothetical protein
MGSRVATFSLRLVFVLLCSTAIGFAGMWVSVNSFTYCSVHYLGGVGAGGGFSIGIGALAISCLLVVWWFFGSLLSWRSSVGSFSVRRVLFGRIHLAGLGLWLAVVAWGAISFFGCEQSLGFSSS